MAGGGPTPARAGRLLVAAGGLASLLCMRVYMLLCGNVRGREDVCVCWLKPASSPEFAGKEKLREGNCLPPVGLGPSGVHFGTVNCEVWPVSRVMCVWGICVCGVWVCVCARVERVS